MSYSNYEIVQQAVEHLEHLDMLSGCCGFVESFRLLCVVESVVDLLQT